MNFGFLTYDDCCLLSNIRLNNKRILYYFERRFKSKSSGISFDFKSILPEQISHNSKISRTFLKCFRMEESLTTDDVDDTISDSSDDNIEDILSPRSLANMVTDDQLDELAVWDPNNPHSQETEDEEEEENDDEQIPTDIPNASNNIDHVIETNTLAAPNTTQSEELFVTFERRSIKHEPITYDNVDLVEFPQLDGQTDNINDNNCKSKRKKNSVQSTYLATRNNDLVDKDKSHIRRLKQHDQTRFRSQQKEESTTFRHHRSVMSNDSLQQVRRFSEQNSNISRKSCINRSLSIAMEEDIRKHSKYPSSKQIPIKLKRLDNSLSRHFSQKKQFSSKTIKTSSNNQTSQFRMNIKDRHNQKVRRRSAHYFDGCIVLDDDDDNGDIQEVEQKSYSTFNNIHMLEKHLDHSVHSSSMRIKWLINLEVLLLEHIFICHQRNIFPLNKAYKINQIKSEANNTSSYHLNPSLLSLIILNFTKMFIIQCTNHSQEEFILFQYGLTSHLRYLFIELPTYNHGNIGFENNCKQCHEYSQLINTLFDLLFDLIEYDLCEVSIKINFRSSLLQDDYFNQLLNERLNNRLKFHRIKLIIYFIELIGLHRSKCSNSKSFSFRLSEERIFQSIEDFIRHVVYQMNDLIEQRIAVCCNVIELCLLFANDRQAHIKQIAVFLSKFCENSTYLKMFAFSQHLPADIRLLLINELILHKLHVKLLSIDYIENVFHRIEISLRPSNTIDEVMLLIIRGLFNSYADLIMDKKNSKSKCSKYSQQITSILSNQLEVIYVTLKNLLYNSTSFDHLKRTSIQFHLLRCKWKKIVN